MQHAGNLRKCQIGRSEQGFYLEDELFVYELFRRVAAGCFTHDLREITLADAKTGSVELQLVFAFAEVVNIRDEATIEILARRTAFFRYVQVGTDIIEQIKNVVRREIADSDMCRRQAALFAEQLCHIHRDLHEAQGNGVRGMQISWNVHQVIDQ